MRKRIEETEERRQLIAEHAETIGWAWYVTQLYLNAGMTGQSISTFGNYDEVFAIVKGAKLRDENGGYEAQMKRLIHPDHPTVESLELIQETIERLQAGLGDLLGIMEERDEELRGKITKFRKPAGRDES